MNDQNETAQRADAVDGQTLIDYFIVHLPVQLLAVDVIGLDRRSVPALTEFCLRAIDTGLSQESDICGFLGINLSYCQSLLSGLYKDEYISKDPFGQYVLLRRGLELLRQGGESSPSDRRINLLWDPIQKKLLDRTLVYTKQRADQAGIFPPIPNVFATPALGELDVSEMNRLRGTNGMRPDAGGASFEVLRVTGIHKSFGRYRQSLALVYKAENGELTFRLAVNGAIDNDITSACAKVGLPKLIGVERGIANKPGVLAVHKRYRGLVCASAEGRNVAALVQRRSVVLLTLRALDSRLAEERLESLFEKKSVYEAELDQLSAELSRLPVVPVRCHEIAYYVVQALENAKIAIKITTTNPSATKVDGEMLKLLRSCLARGVQISIFIADRLGERDPTLAVLDRLSRKGALRVEFLKNDGRSVFEIEWDGKHLLVANEPPLGQRRRPVVPREFAGFYVSDTQAVNHYQENHLKFDASDFLSRFQPSTSGQARSSPRKRRTDARA